MGLSLERIKIREAPAPFFYKFLLKRIKYKLWDIKSFIFSSWQRTKINVMYQGEILYENTGYRKK